MLINLIVTYIKLAIINLNVKSECFSLCSQPTIDRRKALFQLSTVVVFGAVGILSIFHVPIIPSLSIPINSSYDSTNDTLGRNSIILLILKNVTFDRNLA